jgi:hypothetical protein
MHIPLSLLVIGLGRVAQGREVADGRGDNADPPRAFVHLGRDIRHQRPGGDGVQKSVLRPSIMPGGGDLRQAIIPYPSQKDQNSSSGATDECSTGCSHNSQQSNVTANATANSELVPTRYFADIVRRGSIRVYVGALPCAPDD